MKRLTMLVACAAVTGASLAALATMPIGAQAATVELRETMRGPIITNEAGFTLYIFTADKKHQDHCILMTGTYGNCPAIWPPLEVAEGEMPTAGTGLKSKLLGTTTLPGGAKQVTYKRHPLYTYSRDAGPGETSYIGFLAFGGYWYALDGKGRVIQ